MRTVCLTSESIRALNLVRCDAVLRFTCGGVCAMVLETGLNGEAVRRVESASG